MTPSPTKKSSLRAFTYLLYKITLCLALIPIACSFNWQDKNKHNIFAKDRPPLTLFGLLGTALLGLLSFPNWMIYQICSRFEKVIRWCCRSQNQKPVFTSHDLLIKLFMWPVYTATALLLLVPAVLIKSIEYSVRFTVSLSLGLVYLTKSLITTSLSFLFVKKEDNTSNLTTVPHHGGGNPSKKAGKEDLPKRRALSKTSSTNPEKPGACTNLDKPNRP